MKFYRLEDTGKALHIRPGTARNRLMRGQNPAARDQGRSPQAR